MSAYLLIRAQVSDAGAFAEYAQRTREIVRAHGGQYLVVGGAAEDLEGQWLPGTTVISQWPDRAAAQRFWNSPEYAQAKLLREGICNAQVRLVDGIADD